MTALFSKVLGMSLTASIVIVAVCLVRLLLRRAPKVFSYALWAVVLLRLLCPVAFFSQDIGLTSHDIQVLPQNTVPMQDPVLEEIISQWEVQSGQSAPAQSETEAPPAPTPAPQTVQTKNVRVTDVLPCLWLGGGLAMALYSAVQLIRLRRRLVGAVALEKNVYLADHIGTPFVLGVLRPRIYLPAGLDGDAQAYILRHERHHIGRGDHIIKIAAFAALCIHWFNPLVWLAFALSGRDMEMSCDEAVVRRGGDSAGYASLLLGLSTGRRRFAGTLLAFGEGDPKGRIKNILRYKRPALWVIMTVTVLCAVTGVILVTDHVRPSMQWAKTVRTEQIAFVDVDPDPFGDIGIYRLTGEREIKACAKLLHKVKGRYVDAPEGVTYLDIDKELRVYMKDGTQHRLMFYRSGYLYMDGDFYAVPEGFGWDVLSALIRLPGLNGSALGDYRTQRCLYLMPYSSQQAHPDYAFDSDGYLYQFGEASIVIREMKMQEQDGEITYAGGTRWQWEAFPYTDEQWNAFFLQPEEAVDAERVFATEWRWEVFPLTDGEWQALLAADSGILYYRMPLYQYLHLMKEKVLYLPLAADIFLLRVDEMLWVVRLTLTPGGEIDRVLSIYTLSPVQ